MSGSTRLPFYKLDRIKRNLSTVWAFTSAIRQSDRLVITAVKIVDTQTHEFIGIATLIEGADILLTKMVNLVAGISGAGVITGDVGKHFVVAGIGDRCNPTAKIDRSAAAVVGPVEILAVTTPTLKTVSRWTIPLKVTDSIRN